MPCLWRLESRPNPHVGKRTLRSAGISACGFTELSSSVYPGAGNFKLWHPRGRPALVKVPLLQYFLEMSLKRNILFLATLAYGCHLADADTVQLKDKAA